MKTPPIPVTTPTLVCRGPWHVPITCLLIPSEGRQPQHTCVEVVAGRFVFLPVIVRCITVEEIQLCA